MKEESKWMNEQEMNEVKDFRRWCDSLLQIESGGLHFSQS